MKSAEGAPANLRRIAFFLRPHAALYVAGILGIGFANLFINVFLARMLMDLTHGIVAVSRGELASATKAMVAGTLFMTGWVFFSGRVLVLSIHKTANDIRRSLFLKYVEMPLEEIQSRHSGDLMSRSTLGLRQVNSILMGEIQMLMNTLFAGIGSAVYMINLDPRMGTAGIVSGIVPLLVSLPFASPLRKSGIRSQEKQADFTQRMSDLLSGKETIRHLNLADFARTRADAASKEVYAAGMRQVNLAWWQSMAGAATDLSAIGFFLYVSFIGIRNPPLIPAAVAMMQLANPVRRLFTNVGGIISNIQVNIGGVERVVEILDIRDEPLRYTEGAEPRPEVESEILPDEPALRVQNLSFKYDRACDATLKDISFTLGKRCRAALVGPSGGGKSTIIRVIMGLYPPSSGSVTAFGQNLRDVSLRNWRRLYSYVPQDAFLFAGSVYHNILGGMQDVGQERVEEAARLANAHNFINGLPDGYRSQVGERGTNLSGGERQRVAIARAILRDAPILLLDEATASLDAESEALVQEALDRLMRCRTTVVVAHRLSTVRDADEILVVNAGTIVERGSHETLVDLGGLYRRLVEEGMSGKNPGPLG